MLIQSSMLTNSPVPDVLLKKLILIPITKARPGELLVTPLIPIDFFLSLVVEGLHGASALGNPFSLIDVGSVSHCLRSFSFFSFFPRWSHG